MKRAFRRLFTLPFRTRESIQRDVDEELTFHIDMRARELQAAGQKPEDARAAAQAEFGDIDGTRRALNEVDRRIELGQRLATWAGEAVHDTLFALRAAVRAPGFTLVAAGTLALGIGASTAVYSMVHGVLLAPLPYPDQDRVVVLHQFDRKVAAPVHLAPLNFADWRERARSFAHMAIAEPYGMTLTEAGAPAGLDAWRVTTGFFDALGAAPLAGRTFLPAEHFDGAGQVVVLGHRLWRQRFAGDPGIVGRTIVLDGAAHTVVGVMGPRFAFPAQTDIILPRTMPQAGVGRSNRVATFLRGVGRLAPGVTIEQAQAEADRIAAELAVVDPAANREMGALVTPLHRYLTGRVQPILLVLLGAVLLVQLIACANVGSLLLARGIGRRRELAVRAALGAGHGRLARQMLAETTALGLIALALGLALGALGLEALRALAPVDLPRLDDVALDGNVLAFAVVLSAATILVTGLTPALQQSRADASRLLRDGVGNAGRRRRLPAAFLGAQVALTLVLLIGAGLLLRSHARLLQQELGFDPRNTVAVTLHIWSEYPDPAQRVAFFATLMERVDALPGVSGVAAANSLPFSANGSEMDPPFVVEGAPAPETGAEPTALLTIATPGYFEVMGIPLIAGRGFESRDNGGPPVVVISEALARAFFPNENPLGRRLITMRQGAPVSQEIVGVARDVRHGQLDEQPRPEIYAPLGVAMSFGSMTLLIRSEGPITPALLPAAHSVLWSLHPGLVFDQAEHLEERLAESLAPRRFTLALISGFALAALLLSLVGIYSAVGFTVIQRTNEIGIRMALGARGPGVVAQLVREGLLVAAAGTLAGIAGAAALTRWMGSLLFGVSPLDPPTFAALAVLMLGTAALAAWIPARAASRVDPLRAIRA